MPWKIEKVDPREVGLKNVIGVVGHPLTILPDLNKSLLKEGGKVVDLPVYQNPVRVEYEYEPDPEKSYLYTRRAVGLKEVPKKIGLKYVVSRDTLRVVTRENQKLLKQKELREQLKVVQKLPDSPEKESLVNFFEKEIEENQSIFKEIRDDFYAPGDQVRDDRGNVVACVGLIKEIY